MTPRIHHTVYPDKQLSFNEWSYHIHEEIKTDFENKIWNSQIKSEINKIHGKERKCH